jgi:hypothetical protein
MVPSNDPKRDFPTLEAGQRLHLHLIVVAVSYTHLLSNCPLASEDTFLGQALPISSSWKSPPIPWKHHNYVHILTIIIKLYP